MKISLEQFRKLQIEWYQKLKEQGFDDAEELIDGEMLLRQNSNKIFVQGNRRQLSQFSLGMIEEYYRLVSMIANDSSTYYRNLVDEFVMKRHAEGAKISTICLELKVLKMSRDRKNVRLIIRRHEMKWGIKLYTRKQLHMK